MDTLELTRSEAQIKVSTGTRTIADFIDDIKHERKSRRPELEKKRKAMDEVSGMLDKFDELKRQIIDENGRPAQGSYQAIVNLSGRGWCDSGQRRGMCLQWSIRPYAVHI